MGFHLKLQRRQNGDLFWDTSPLGRQQADCLPWKHHKNHGKTILLGLFFFFCHFSFSNQRAQERQLLCIRFTMLECIHVPPHPSDITLQCINLGCEIPWGRKNLEGLRAVKVHHHFLLFQIIYSVGLLSTLLAWKDAISHCTGYFHFPLCLLNEGKLPFM